VIDDFALECEGDDIRLHLVSRYESDPGNKDPMRYREVVRVSGNT